ncbi:hypothetical protein LEP1GSC126_1214 [Leptospira kirschneri str. 200801774]|nr:hypothetical protein LEP1GSC126_1214 [Leptospira kirschneri str. 200801774]
MQRWKSLLKLCQLEMIGFSKKNPKFFKQANICVGSRQCHTYRKQDFTIKIYDTY